MYTIEELAYFAGFLDGEGCFNIRVHHPKKNPDRSHYMCRICITGTDKQIMDWILKRFGGNYHKRSRGSTYKPVYHWNLSGPPMTELVKLILPYLVVKKAQAKTMLRFRSTFDPNRWNQTPLSKKEIEIRAECIQKLHYLNHRGTTRPCPLSPSSLR